MNAPPSTATSSTPPSAQALPEPSISTQCWNWKLRPPRSAGSEITGEVRRWSLIDEESTAFHELRRELGRLPEICQVSVPAAASCVHELSPVGTSSSNSTCVVVPVLHSPGAGAVRNE